MAFSPEQHRAYREKLKREGVCPSCHKRNPEGGLIVCKVCNKRARDRDVNLKKRGLCKSCTCPLDNPALNRCVNCQAKESRSNFWRRQRRQMDDSW